MANAVMEAEGLDGEEPLTAHESSRPRFHMDQAGLRDQWGPAGIWLLRPCEYGVLV
ncbi:MAG: hypothetical protein ACUVS3_00955 [Thermodesulfobacteriota bacterium]